jgi:hypothetical protein
MKKDQDPMEKLHRTGLLPRLRTAAQVAAAAVVIAACSSASTPEPEPVATTSSALAIPGLFATGVNAAGVPLANGAVDPHYTLTSNDPNFPGPNAVAVAANAAWTPNTAASKWISIQASTQGANNGIYKYTAMFTLAGAAPTTATISGTWAADDSVTLDLNGTQVAAYPAEAYGALAPFTVAAGSPFVLGTNTLVFTTVNSGNGPTGLQVATIAGTATGCTLDSDCTAAQFCDTQTFACTGKLANGVAVPTLTGHTPPLTGVCSAAVGTSVCLSGVCDTGDNECGYANGDGPCTAGTGGNGGTVCRSGACSVSGVCEPAGGCEVDADCTGGDWCDESTTTCTPQLANGQTIPTDPPHTNPTLNGMCTAGAGALVCTSGVCDAKNEECGYVNGDGPCDAADGGGSVCQSGVCDKDGDCGYANGDGPCTPANEGTVCRSGTCSTTGVCEPAGGCESDADCTGGKWCDETTATCTARLANGQPVPDDPPHTSPTLDGTCSVAAGSLVCVSGVCDPKDNECGYANGDGPCDAGDGATVCRSTACSVNGTCEPMGGCNVDGDCTNPATPDCSPTTHTCVAVPDAGKEGGTADAGAEGGTTTDAGTADAATPEAGVDSGHADAASADATVDASTEEDASSEPGYLEGGGLSCGVTSGVGTGEAGGMTAVSVLAMVGIVRRRRRARAS